MRAFFALLFSLLLSPALAQVTPGTSPLSIAKGGTAGATAPAARTNLGLGTIATQNANSVAITGGAITGLPTPTSPSDAATKQYADGISAGLIVLAPSRLATAAVLPNAPVYANGTAGVGATLTAGANSTLTVDGAVANLNDVILVQNQASAFQNGIYTVTNAGSGAAAWVLTRATYFDHSAVMLAGSFTFISSGSANSGKAFTLAATVTTVGTTAANFNLYSISLPSIANNQVLANTSGSPQTPVGTGLSAWFDSTVCNIVGSTVRRSVLGWACSSANDLRPQDYGAVCDGATDSTTNLQTAITAAGTQKVPLRIVGKCAVSGVITMLSNTTINCGNNKTDGFLALAAAGTMAQGILYNNNGTGNIKVRNCYFGGNLQAEGTPFTVGAMEFILDNAGSAADMAGFEITGNYFENFNQSSFVWFVVAGQVGATSQIRDGIFAGNEFNCTSACAPVGYYGAATSTLSSASVSGSVLTATIASGTLHVGDIILGTSVPANTSIASFGTGTGASGNTGTYNLSASIGTIGSEAMTAKAVNNNGNSVLRLSANTQFSNPSNSGSIQNFAIFGNHGDGAGVSGLVNALTNVKNITVSGNATRNMGNNTLGTDRAYTYLFYNSATGVSADPENITISNNSGNGHHNNAVYLAGVRKAAVTGNSFSSTSNSSGGIGLAWGSDIALNGCLDCTVTGNTLSNSLTCIADIGITAAGFASNTEIGHNVCHSAVNATATQNPIGIRLSGDTAGASSRTLVDANEITMSGTSGVGIGALGGGGGIGIGYLTLSNNDISAASFGIQASGPLNGALSLKNNRVNGALGLYGENLDIATTGSLRIDNEHIDAASQVAGGSVGFLVSTGTDININGLTIANGANSNVAFSALGVTGCNLRNVSFPNWGNATQAAATSWGTVKPTYAAKVNCYVQNVTPSVTGTTPNSYLVKGWPNLSGSTTWFEDRTGLQ